MARTSIQEIFASFASFPSVGWSNILYIATDTNVIYRWDGASYVSVSWEWLAWNTSISGATGTGLLLTMSNSYAASGIGQSIVIGNTQTQRLIWLNVDTWTSTPLHTWISLNSNQTDRAYSMQIRHYSSATQAVTAEYALALGDNWNTNSANNTRKIFIENENNAGAWDNTGIYINHYNTTGSAVAWEGNAFTIYQQGAWWTSIHIYADNNTNSSTNGLVNYTLSNTQSGASVIQKINLWSSAQAHSAYYATGSNASSTAVAFNAAMATWWTGKLFSGSVNSVEKFAVNADGSIVNTPLVSATAWYLNMPQNSQSAAYTTVAWDSGKHILHPTADTTARTFTIDSNANVAYPIGTALTFVNQDGAGVVTIAITSDTMRLAWAGTTWSRTLAANGVATAIKIASKEWIIDGVWLT